MLVIPAIRRLLRRQEDSHESETYSQSQVYRSKAKVKNITCCLMTEPSECVSIRLLTPLSETLPLGVKSHSFLSS